MAQELRSSGGVTAGALVRSIRAMSIGSIKAHTDVNEGYADEAMGEIDQQFQVPISGVAARDIEWTSVALAFPAAFADGRDERNAPFLRPAFTSGVVLERGGQGAIVVVNLINWTGAVGTDPGDASNAARTAPVGDEDVESYTTAAAVAIGVFTLTDDPVEFAGEVHLNFQGWGAPKQPEQAIDESTGG